MNATRVSDLTVDELQALIRSAVREALQAERMALTEEPERNPQYSILDIPPLELDPGHPALQMLSREDMYGGEGRQANESNSPAYVNAKIAP